MYFQRIIQLDRLEPSAPSWSSILKVPSNFHLIICSQGCLWSSTCHLWSFFLHNVIVKLSSKPRQRWRAWWSYLQFSAGLTSPEGEDIFIFKEAKVEWSSLSCSLAVLEGGSDRYLLKPKRPEVSWEVEWSSLSCSLAVLEGGSDLYLLNTKIPSWSDLHYPAA